MKIRIFALVAILIAVFSALPFSPALAQTPAAGEPTGFQNVTLWVNPEYDNPHLLVMLEGKITGAQAPALVRFLVPSSAQMYSAGSKDAQGQYSGGPPDRKASSIPGWDEISYTMTSNTFRMEYYDPTLIDPNQAAKTISYDFRLLYPISDMKVYMQEPKNSSNYTITPDGPKSQDYDGLAIHSYSFADLKTDSPLHFDIAYTKTDPNPSFSNQFLPTDGTDVPGSAPASSGPGAPLIIGLSVVGIAAVIAPFLLSRKSPPKTRAERRRAGVKPATKSGAKQDGANFCGSCGEAVKPTNKFCPGCGEKLS